MNRTERVMARRQIKALIKSDPVELELTRRVKVKAPTGGGWKWDFEGPMAAQEVTIVPFKRRMTEFLINTELGDLPDLPYVIIGYPDLDVQKDDRFYWQGDLFVVKTIDIKQEVRVAAQVDYYGGTING